jgi:hypothetical protein
MTERDQEEQDLRIQVMQADLRLKAKQSFWETPRNLFIMAGALVAIVATLAGLAGYRAGQQAPAATVGSVSFPPGTVITIPAATKP